MLVLDVIGEREVHHVGALALEEGQARRQHVLGELGAVDVGHGHRHQVGHALDAVLGLAHLRGLLRGKADAVHAVPEQPPELVLGGDDHGPGAGPRQLGEQRRAAQELRVVHHDLSRAGGVVEVVAGDPVDRRRDPGHDREIVRIGEARHHAAGERGEARSPETGDGRAPAGSDGRIEVRRLGAVDADDDDRIAWTTVGAAIDGDRGPRGHGRHGYYYGGVAGRG